MKQAPVRSSFPAVVAILGAFAIFSFVINEAYVKEDSSVEAEVVERPSLAEHQASENDTLNSAQVIDANSGKVRLTIKRAMELVIAENAE